MSKIKFYKDSAKTQQVYPELDPEDITKFESLEDIENAFPNVSGEDTNLTLNHTVEAPMKLELAPSELEQETTSGKNLLGLTNGSYSSSGITAVVQDGLVTLSGSATGGVCVISIPLLKVITSDVGTLTKSLNPTGTYTGVQTSLRAQNPETSVGLWSNDGGNKTEALSADAYYFRIQINANITVNGTLKPQVEVGSAATTWGKYTGGLPQPNPDFPSQVHSVSGSNKIWVCGKNLCDSNAIISGYTISSGQIYKNNGTSSFINNEGTITFTTTSQWRGCISDYIPIKGDTYYIVSYEKLITGVTYFTFYNFYDKDKNFINRASSQAGYIAPENAKYLVIFIGINEIGTASITNIQLEENTNPTIYEEFKGRTLSLDLPVENLFDKNNSNILNECTINSSTKLIEANSQYKMLYVPCLPNTIYTISKIESNYLTVGTTETTPAIGVYVNNYTVATDTTRCTIKTDSTANFIIIRYWRTTDTLSEAEIRDSIQIEYGAHANAYTPYGTTPLEYCKIGDYSDEFFKNDPSDPNYSSSLELDKWYLKKNIGKCIINVIQSSMSHATINNVSNTQYTTFTPQPYMKAQGSNKSNLFYSTKNVYLNDARRTFEGYPSYVIAKSMVIATTPDDTLNNLKNNVNGGLLYYQLETPEYILLSDTLQHQLDDIYNWVESYSGQTNISQINNDLPFIISARAMKDLSIIDEYPTENSEHLVESGGVYEVVNDLDVVQEEHTAQIKALERASLIYNAMPKVTVTGTNLTINDTAECPLEIDLGATELEQETTTGINLFEKLSNSPKSGGVTYSQDLQSVVVNYANSGDEYFKVCDIESPTTKAYTLYFVASGIKSGETPRYNAYSNMSTLLTLVNGINIVNIPSGTSINLNRLIIDDQNKTTYPNTSTVTFSNFMLVEGTYTAETIGDYEPYTGGIPAPNPEFPMDIHTISGDNEIKIQNKNLFSSQWEQGARNNSDGKTEIYSTAYVRTQTPIIVEPNTQYAINIVSSKQTGGGDIHYYDENYNFIRREALPKSSYKTTPDNCHYINLQLFLNSGISPSDVLTTQLEKGSTATSYTPHKEQSLPLNLPVENLFDKSTALIGKNWNGNDMAYSIASDYIEVKENENYILSVSNMPNYTSTTIVCFDNNKEYILPALVANPFITLQNTKYIKLSIRCDSSHTWTQEELNNANIQLEEGTKANSYTPYGKPALEYSKIGDYEDEFVIPGGKNQIGFIDTPETTINGLTYSIYNGILNINGTASTFTPLQNLLFKLTSNNSKKFQVYLLSGTYTNSSIGIQFRNDNGNLDDMSVLHSTSNLQTLKEITSETLSETKYIRFYIGSDARLVDARFRLMLVDGNDATIPEYEPYNPDGKWYLKKNIDKTVLNGGEGWLASSNQPSNGLKVYLSRSDLGKINQFYCNFLTPITTGEYNNATKQGLCIGTNSIYNVCLLNTTMTLAEWKTFLSNNNMITYHPSPNPEYILLNDTLQSQLNDIAEAISYQDQTNIPQINNDLPFTITATAVQDINKLIATLTNAIIEIGGE